MRCQNHADGGESTNQGVAEPAAAAQLESVFTVRRTLTESRVRPSETQNSHLDSATSGEEIDFHESVVKVVVN